MSIIKEKIQSYSDEVSASNCQLVAVSKTKPVSDILEAYDAGQRVFGENKVQELREKHELLPKDIQWHMIGHLQSNKVKYIAPFVTLIHAVDSFKLLKEINKQAAKVDRRLDCLLQVHIAQEETKFGLSIEEIHEIINSEEFQNLSNIKIIGLMGMATNTEKVDQVRQEFESLRKKFNDLKNLENEKIEMRELSIGMSNDYQIALECGSTMVRIGSSIFGNRNYNTHV